MSEKPWLARPYEATEWRLTYVQPTEELRRWIEFKPVSAALPRTGD